MAAASDKMTSVTWRAEEQGEEIVVNYDDRPPHIFPHEFKQRFIEMFIVC